jgi:hypothetical protein
MGDRVTPKESIGNSLYFLVYGKESILPNGLYLPSLQLSQESRGHPSSTLQQRIDTLLMLDEEREKDKVKFTAHQQVVKRWFDKHKAKEKNFEVGDLVLKWDKENSPKENTQSSKIYGSDLFRWSRRSGQAHTGCKI